MQKKLSYKTAEINHRIKKALRKQMEFVIKKTSLLEEIKIKIKYQQQKKRVKRRIFRASFKKLASKKSIHEALFSIQCWKKNITNLISFRVNKVKVFFLLKTCLKNRVFSKIKAKQIFHEAFFFLTPVQAVMDKKKRVFCGLESFFFLSTTLKCSILL